VELRQVDVERFRKGLKSAPPKSSEPVGTAMTGKMEQRRRPMARPRTAPAPHSPRGGPKGPRKPGPRK